MLLDDVGSELDSRRRDALLEYVSGAGQALLTATDPGLMKGRKGHIYEVEQKGGEAGVFCR
jgi:recombinational DNA repair ATPase RecF